MGRYRRQNPARICSDRLRQGFLRYRRVDVQDKAGRLRYAPDRNDRPLGNPPVDLRPDGLYGRTRNGQYGNRRCAEPCRTYRPEQRYPQSARPDRRPERQRPHQRRQMRPGGTALARHDGFCRDTGSRNTLLPRPDRNTGRHTGPLRPGRTKHFRTDSTVRRRTDQRACLGDDYTESPRTGRTERHPAYLSPPYPVRQTGQRNDFQRHCLERRPQDDVLRRHAHPPCVTLPLRRLHGGDRLRGDSGANPRRDGLSGRHDHRQVRQPLDRALGRLRRRLLEPAFRRIAAPDFRPVPQCGLLCVRR